MLKPSNTTNALLRQPRLPNYLFQSFDEFDVREHLDAVFPTELSRWFFIEAHVARTQNLCFGGEKFDTIYATCGDRVYKRKVKATGAHAWDAPHKPAGPRL